MAENCEQIVNSKKNRMTTFKLIQHYQKMATDCDVLIEHYQQSISKLRKENPEYLDSSDFTLLSHEKAVAQAKRQAYIQFISDLEAL